MSEGVKNLFLSYGWPGNVRQLENTIRNILVLHDESYIEASMIPALPNAQNQSQPVAATVNTVASEVMPSQSFTSPSTEANPVISEGATAFSQADIEPLWLVEKRYIEQAIDACDNNIPKAAALLDVSPSTIYRKIKSWEEMQVS